MKRLLTLIGIAAACSAYAQLNRVEYFWDTDPGFGNGIALSVATVDSVSSVFPVSTLGLQPGMHTLYVRSRDVQGRWSVFSKKMIQVNAPIAPLATAEYFFDTDPGFGNGTPITFTAGDSIDLATTVNTTSLTPGLHTLYVRVRDTGGRWSVFSKRVIHIQQPANIVNEIVAAEYFFDTDPGFGNGTPIPITPGDSIDMIAQLNTASLTPGLHTVYIRVKTSNDEWSVFSKRVIHIQQPADIVNEIVAAEYFFDTDPGFGNGTPILITPGDSIDLVTQLNTTSLAPGLHTVYIRVKTSNDEWSVFSKRMIHIQQPADSSQIVAAEYFYDTDPGFGNGTPITITAGDSVLTNFQAPTNALLIGPHWLYVRVKDNLQRWSVYSKDSLFVGNFNCAIYGNGEIQLAGDTCRGSEVTFIDKTAFNSGVNSADYTRQWDIFNDGTVDFTNDTSVNFTFNQTGTYTVRLKINEIANPYCQEVIFKTVTIRRVDTTYNNVTICDGQSYPAGGGNQTTSGVYYDTYSNRYGCDSVRITNLTVTPKVTPAVSINTASDRVCSGVSIQFTATPFNGGASPYFIWKVDGNIVGAGYAFQGYNPFGISFAASGVVTCEMTSSETCTTVNPVVSNSLPINVTQSVTASITIDVDTNDFCYGTAATFMVTGVTNPGMNPQYNWYVDNSLAQSGGTTYISSALMNGNTVRCYLTSNETCVSNSPVSSNAIYMTVYPHAFPDVSISANMNNVCYGTPITFTAFANYGGNNPAYQWFLNDTLVQSGSSNAYMSDTLDDGDEIKCILTSDYQCRLADNDTSNAMTVDILYSLPVSVTLTPSGNNICRGTGVMFTASVANGGSPNYEFFVNGSSVQNSSLYYYTSFALNNNDSVWVVVTSDISCATNNPAVSNKVYMTVIEYDTVSVSITATRDSICEGTNVVFTANAVNAGAAPTYLWRVNTIPMQSGMFDTFSSASLGNGSFVRCEVFGDHQCVTPNPAISNSIIMTVTDTLLPSVIVTPSNTLICEGTNVDFTATLTNEGSSPLIEWLINGNVVQTGGLSYNSSVLQDFDAVRVRLTSDYACPIQNPVNSNNVVMTVMDSITPSVFVNHGPNPACPGSLISVFANSSTGGSQPVYEFRKNGIIVQSGQSSQYTSSNFSDGDVMQVTMTSNANCLRTATAVSNPDTIKIQSFIPAAVSIQQTSSSNCVGDAITFEATTTTGGTNPIFTWRVNNSVFQSGVSNIFTTTALPDSSVVFCEMNSSLTCATNNPAQSNSITVRLINCISCDSLDCRDNNLCTTDTCINGQCLNTPIICADNDVCNGLETCDATSGICLPGVPLDCSDGDTCTIDFCHHITGCSHSPVNCSDGDVCNGVETCDSNSGACLPGTPLNCADTDTCTIDGCNSVTGCTYLFNPNCNDPCAGNPCDDGNACTDDACSSAAGCQYSIHNCDDGNACTDDACSPAAGCQYSIHNCDDGNACTDDACSPAAGCQYSIHNCDDGNACTLDSCNSSSGCFYTDVICDDGDLCTDDTCDRLAGCIFIPANCNDGDSCTVDKCEFGVCLNDPVICNDADACTRDTCMSGGCFFIPVTCNDNSACTLDSCGTTGCFFTPVVCDDGNACTGNICDLLSGCNYPPLNCDDGDTCTIDGCDIATGCFHNRIHGCGNPCTGIVCDDGDACTFNGCDSLSGGCSFTPVICNDNNPCTQDVCQAGNCIFQPVVCNDNNFCTTDTCVNGVCQFVEELRVVSFTLVDAGTDTDIGLLTDGAVIDLAVNGLISIRADVCSAANVESVKFLLNGSFYKMENLLFYTIAGDNNGNYNPWNVQPGVYTIRAIPYSGNNGTGTVGIYHEITITIINSSPPCGGNERRVVSFTLVDAGADADIGMLLDGDTIDLSVTPLISVRANVCFEGNIESVKFLVNGSFHIMENILFYTIAGDNNGNYNPWNVQPGVYTIRAIPYSGNNGAGLEGTFLEITVVVIDGTLPCTPGQIAVTSFTLVNSDDDTDIRPLGDGDTVNLAVTPSINVRANVFCEGNIKSVKFLVNGSTFRMENVFPYMLAGDNNGNYYKWNVQPGAYTIRAIPYNGTNGTGMAGIYREITIVIIDGTQPCGVNDIRVTSFTLVSAVSNTDIAPLADGAVIDLALTGKINVRANVFCNEHIESVRFKLNSNHAFRIENVEPYALAGDFQSDYYTWNVQAGIYTIQATPYSGNNATGTAGTPLSITVTVVGSAAKMDAAGQLMQGDPAEDAMFLNAYPNPFSDILNIQFTLREDSRVKLEMFSTAGQKLATLFEGDVKASELRSFEYAPRLIYGGMIVYRLQTARGTYYGKAIMMK